jgi:hypothetical protein
MTRRSSYETFTLSCTCIWCRKVTKSVEISPTVAPKHFLSTLATTLADFNWQAVRINDKIVGRICPSCYQSNFAADEEEEDDAIDYNTVSDETARLSA